MLWESVQKFFPVPVSEVWSLVFLQQVQGTRSYVEVVHLVAEEFYAQSEKDKSLVSLSCVQISRVPNSICGRCFFLCMWFVPFYQLSGHCGCLDLYPSPQFYLIDFCVCFCAFITMALKIEIRYVNTSALFLLLCQFLVFYVSIDIFDCFMSVNNGVGIFW